MSVTATRPGRLDAPTVADLLVSPSESWRLEALCAGAWQEFDQDENREAAELCGGCPVKASCVQAAFDTESPGNTHGVLGGMTASERTRVLRREMRHSRSERHAEAQELEDRRRELHAAGLSDGEIATATGATSKRTIQSWRNHRNLPPNKPGMRPEREARHAERLELHAAGHTDEQIAVRQDTTPRTIGKWRVKNGLLQNVAAA